MKSTGVVTFTQVNNIWHSDTTNPDDLATLTAGEASLLQIVQTLTDADGDHVSTPLDLGTGVFTIQDSGPSLLAKSNLVYANVDNGTGDVGGTGIYHYNIGTDGPMTYVELDAFGLLAHHANGQRRRRCNYITDGNVGHRKCRPSDVPC